MIEINPLEIALRRNHCKKVMSEFILDLQENLEMADAAKQLLGLQETIRLWNLVKEKMACCDNCSILCFRRSWSNFEQDHLKKLLFCLKGELASTNLILFRPYSEFCGAVVINSEYLLDRALKLTSLDQDEMISCNEDCSFGLVLSYDVEKLDSGNDARYELLVWGEKLVKYLEEFSMRKT